MESMRFMGWYSGSLSNTTATECNEVADRPGPMFTKHLRLRALISDQFLNLAPNARGCEMDARNLIPVQLVPGEAL